MKLIASDDDKTVDIVVQGDDEEITRMTKELQLQEKGMVYVPGVLEGMSQE
jgi:acylphosphatase